MLGRIRTRLRRTNQGAGDQLQQQRQRFARRQWQRRWLTWKRLVALLAIVVVVAGGVWLVLFSSHLALKKVKVEGVSYLSREEVLATANLPMGEPLARLNLARASDLVGSLRAVKSVDMVREWPTSVRIIVTERTAVAVVQSGRLVRGLDADGVLFRDYAKRPATLPLVKALDDNDEKALAEAARVAGSLPAQVSKQVSVVNVASRDDISLDLRNGTRVTWGSAARSSEKATVLVALLKQKGRVYDVSSPKLATVRD